jgi:hypothetical protein
MKEQSISKHDKKKTQPQGKRRKYNQDNWRKFPAQSMVSRKPNLTSQQPESFPMQNCVSVNISSTEFNPRNMNLLRKYFVNYLPARLKKSCTNLFFRVTGSV